jgi:hypothetical protein
LEPEGKVEAVGSRHPNESVAQSGENLHTAGG